jgi:hypothetical protein
MTVEVLLTKTTSLDEFCRAGGIDVSSIPDEVDASLGLARGDALLAAGSVVEGLGNSRSDLDLLLFTARPEQLLPRRDEVALVIGRHVVDVRILRWSQVEAQLSRLREWRDQPWDVTHHAGFTMEDRVLLHRLLHGRALSFPASGDSPRPAADDLALLKLHVARHMSRTIQVDLCGYLECEDYASLVFAAQELLGHAVDALVAAHGLTNPHPKWRMRLLSAVPANWETFVVLRPEHMSIAERTWRLHRAPEHLRREECLRHALDISSFARAVFLWSERRLRLRRPSERLAWPDAKPSGADSTLPDLSLDVDFLLSDGDAALGRLNGFGETLGLSAGELDVAVLCDGITTARAAEAVAAIPTSGSLADDLIPLLARAGLLL